jgi:enterochelin esterase-like enzyme
MKTPAASILLCVSATLAQTPPAFNSAQANPDHTITFRYQDPNATAVVLNIDTAPKPIPMNRGADGLWTYTTEPLAPEIYSYRFDVDGRPQFDPNNLTGITPNLVYRGDQVEVPGDTAQLWDTQNVPHGTLHRHRYTTAIVKGLPSNTSQYLVYTPPGYDPRGKTKYPVLYLLHGWSNTVDTWTETLQADLILDNLLAQKKIKPMIVVMPLGYGDMSFINGPIGEMWKQKPLVNRNTELFSQALLTEILPRVEAEYNISTKREDRAIAGLSMGGLESLEIGLNHTDKFASIGGFSAADHLLDPATQLPVLQPATAQKTANLKLLWIACGTEDGLITANRKLVAYLKGEGLPVTAVETPGAHVSFVWRDNLIHFAPLLFQSR